MISARGTNLDELIAKGETPRDARELLEQHESGKLKIDNLEIWKTDCPELSLQNNDLFVDAAGSSGGWGDPLDREPQLVVNDLNQGVSTEYQFLSDMHGVVAEKNELGTWELDEKATMKKRADLRQLRLNESQPVAEWWKTERQMVQKTGFNEEVKEMYQQSLSFDKFRDEFCSFWQLNEDYMSEE